MSSRDILDRSIAVSLFRYLYKGYRKIKQRTINIFCYSQTWRLVKGLRTGVKTCFRNSFWGKITEIKQTSSGVLDSSRAVRYSICFYKRWRNKIIGYSQTSLVTEALKDTKEQFVLVPLKIISTIIVTAILVNVALSLVLHRPIGLWGWLMRALFLFSGIPGLFCRADWLAIKQSGIFLRKAKIN